MVRKRNGQHSSCPEGWLKDGIKLPVHLSVRQGQYAARAVGIARSVFNLMVATHRSARAQVHGLWPSPLEMEKQFNDLKHEPEFGMEYATLAMCFHRERLLREDTAAALHQWAAAVAPHTLGPEQSPIITEYGGTTFRSQLEARWAAWFDKRGIAWEYEPARFDGWTPDFRLVMDGVETYAEVKPVSEFPMDVAQRILNSGWTGDVFILGSSPRHAWRYRGDGWHPVDLATSRGMHQ